MCLRPRELTISGMMQYVCCIFRAPVLTAQLASWSRGERIRIRKISRQKHLATDTYHGPDPCGFLPLQHVAFISAKASSVHTIRLLRASMP